MTEMKVLSFNLTRADDIGGDVGFGLVRRE